MTQDINYIRNALKGFYEVKSIYDIRKGNIVKPKLKKPKLSKIFTKKLITNGVSVIGSISFYLL